MAKIRQKRYYATSGAGIKEEDAQPIGEYIDSIGVKDPKKILKHAKADKKCPLNKYLDWNNKSAGEKWRLFQVRNIINHLEIKVIYEGSSRPVKAFYSITENDDKQYVGLTDALDNADWREQIVARGLGELRAWIVRYGVYEELRPIVRLLKPYVKQKKELVKNRGNKK